MTRLALVLLCCLLSGVALAEPVRGQLARPDGTQIDYTVDAPAGDPSGLVVLLSGSGCAPGAQSPNLALARAAFAQHVALIVEKRGVAPDGVVADGFSDCPPQFHAGHTVSQRVEDTAAVIKHLGIDGGVTLFGGSEGGLTVAMLATRVEVRSAIILSSGMGLAFDDLVLRTVPPEGQVHVAAGFAAAKADPQGLTLFAGSSHRFWADILALRGLDFMLKTETPFLLIQGGRDASSPVAAARETADRFASDGRCTLTYWELPALDHGLVDPAGLSHVASVLAQAAVWAENPPGGCGAMQP